MKTLKFMLAAALSGFIMQSSAQTGAIKGQILNNDQEPVYGATIKVTQGNVLIGGTSTDENGKYTYKPLTAGIYEIIVQSVETQTKRINKIEINPDKTTYVDVKVSKNEFPDVIVEAEYEKPIVDKNFVDMQSLNAEEFLHMAVDRGDIKAAIVNIASDVSQDDNGDLHVRGGRGEATAFIVDGVRSPGITGVAALSVENVSIITGGIPAQYGDATSGFIVVTTKDYFSGIRSKRMRESYINEKYAYKQREKKAKEEEEKRKKEIEEELKKEAEEKLNKQ